MLIFITRDNLRSGDTTNEHVDRQILFSSFVGAGLTCKRTGAQPSIKPQRIKHIYRVIDPGPRDEGDFGCQIIGELGYAGHRR